MIILQCFNSSAARPAVQWIGTVQSVDGNAAVEEGAITWQGHVTMQVTFIIKAWFTLLKLQQISRCNLNFVYQSCRKRKVAYILNSVHVEFWRTSNFVSFCPHPARDGAFYDGSPALIKRLYLSHYSWNASKDESYRTCDCLNGGSCQARSQSCRCQPGWTGGRCEEPCLSGFYGEECALSCGCGDNSTCSVMTGLCSCAGENK